MTRSTSLIASYNVVQILADLIISAACEENLIASSPKDSGLTMYSSLKPKFFIALATNPILNS